MSLSNGMLEWCESDIMIDLNLTLEQCISLERQWAYLAVAPAQKDLTYVELINIIESIYQICNRYGYTGFRYRRLQHEGKTLAGMGLSNNTLINESKAAQLVKEIGEGGEYACIHLLGCIYSFKRRMNPDGKRKVKDDRKYTKALLQTYKAQLLIYYEDEME